MKKLLTGLMQRLFKKNGSGDIPHDDNTQHNDNDTQNWLQLIEKILENEGDKDIEETGQDIGDFGGFSV
jgi:hypothetical protein